MRNPSIIETMRRYQRVLDAERCVRVYDGKPTHFDHAEAQRLAFWQWRAEQEDLELTKGDR